MTTKSNGPTGLTIPARSDDVEPHPRVSVKLHLLDDGQICVVGSDDSSETSLQLRIGRHVEIHDAGTSVHIQRLESEGIRDGDRIAELKSLRPNDSWIASEGGTRQNRQRSELVEIVHGMWLASNLAAVGESRTSVGRHGRRIAEAHRAKMEAFSEVLAHLGYRITDGALEEVTLTA